EIVLDDGGIDIVQGDDRDNEMTGSDETDRMHGGRGDDLLSGDAGDDWLNGGGNSAQDEIRDLEWLTRNIQQAINSISLRQAA
ncbi:MAG: hypothetical protein AB2535_21220, partial [Candidatus Thiodiazotropha endolucinida]